MKLLKESPPTGHRDNDFEPSALGPRHRGTLESAEALMDIGTDPARVRQSVRQALALTQSNLEEARRSVLDSCLCEEQTT